ncbi:MAG: hypothetical protein PHQ58_04670 [Rhodoferax sp.]|uniref:hypothetical protein n=1 Tax=Rhodoferax sp. TaxID=50421 RepID=UPI00262A7CF0|nr:hypothetical protein [Rhodoferax sp.]MDD2879706.1 hypothetical protein [Rhodoferax sp.]
MKLIHTDKNGLTVHTDEVNPGHQYQVSKDETVFADLRFQKGPINQAGVNGLTNEALIEILLDRIEQLDKVVPCVENCVARIHLSAALNSFELRQRRRDEEIKAANTAAAQNG